MPYDYIKALHIIFVVTWFSGLFYLPRLFIYFVEANEREDLIRDAFQEQFLIMQRRLWYGITWPSCVLAILFGGSMIHYWMPLSENPWLITKLCFVFFLFLYHLSLGKIYKRLKSGESKLTSFQLRLWNEVSTLFLVAIVFLVVLKNILSMGYGIIGLVGLVILLVCGIKVYKNIRTKG